jgi:hypothetical protein
MTFKYERKNLSKIIGNPIFSGNSLIFEMRFAHLDKELRLRNLRPNLLMSYKHKILVIHSLPMS